MSRPAQAVGSMLREILIVEQTNPTLRRRWFQSDYFDLFVWQEAGGAFTRFQLCYDVERNERALAWRQAGGFHHDGVDHGDGGFGTGHGQTPIMVVDGKFDSGTVAPRFEREAANIPPELRDFILARIREYLLERHRLKDGRRRVRREGWQQHEKDRETPAEN